MEVFQSSIGITVVKSGVDAGLHYLVRDATDLGSTWSFFVSYGFTGLNSNRDSLWYRLS